MKKIVISISGKALGKTCEEQFQIIKNASEALVDLIEDGNEVVIAYGSVPQFEMINLAMETASKSEHNIEEIPFSECAAMTQGYIGYHVQNAIREEFVKRDSKLPVATIISQVVVDKTDTEFENPTKFIGHFYSEEEANKLQQGEGYKVKESTDGKWRRVVPSPPPVDIVEKELVKAFINKRHVPVIGVGVPVVAEGNSLVGVTAVIDEDLVNEMLAEYIDAQYFVMLIEEEKVPINHGKSNEVDLDSLTVLDAQKYVDAGCFDKEIILPKVEAAIKFVNSKSGRKAVIGSIHNPKDVFTGKSGTIIEE